MLLAFVSHAPSYKWGTQLYHGEYDVGILGRCDNLFARGFLLVGLWSERARMHRWVWVQRLSHDRLVSHGGSNPSEFLRLD